jgi:hypothetical protein
MSKTNEGPCSCRAAEERDERAPAVEGRTGNASECGEAYGAIVMTLCVISAKSLVALPGVNDTVCNRFGPALGSAERLFRAHDEIPNAAIAKLEGRGAAKRSGSDHSTGAGQPRECVQRKFISLSCGQTVEPHGLLVVPRKPAAPLLVHPA